MSYVTIRRAGSQIGRIFIEGRKSDGTCRAVRYDLTGERRLRQEIRAAIERNTLGIEIGTLKPRSLSVWTRGVVLAIQAVADSHGLDLEPKGIDEWDE